MQCASPTIRTPPTPRYPSCLPKKCWPGLAQVPSFRTPRKPCGLGPEQSARTGTVLARTAVRHRFKYLGLSYLPHHRLNTQTRRKQLPPQADTSATCDETWRRTLKPADLSALPTVTQQYRLSFRCAQQCSIPTGDFNDFAESDQHCLQSLGGPGTFAFGQQRADPYPPRSANRSQGCHVDRTTNGELWQGCRLVAGWPLLRGHRRGVLTSCSPPSPSCCIRIPCEKRDNPDGPQTKKPAEP